VNIIIHRLLTKFLQVYMEACHILLGRP